MLYLNIICLTKLPIKTEGNFYNNTTVIFRLGWMAELFQFSSNVWNCAYSFDLLVDVDQLIQDISVNPLKNTNCIIL